MAALLKVNVLAIVNEYRKQNAGAPKMAAPWMRGAPFSKYNEIPGRALHEKGLQQQKGVGPLVSGQEQRALLVLVINRTYTGYTRGVNISFCSSIGLQRISLVCASGEMFRRRFFDALEGTRGACFLGELFCRRHILTDPAPPLRCALDPTGSFYVRDLDSTGEFSQTKSCFFSDMPCMKKGLQRKKGVGPLVSSQEQRALPVLVISRT